VKIAFVIEECNKQGGQERVVAELAERMCQKHEVHVFAHSWSDLDPARITFHFVPMCSRPSFLILPTFIKGTRRVLNPNEFDIIHGQGPNCLLANVVTCHTCHAAKIRVIPPAGLSLKQQAAKFLFDQIVLAYERRTYAPATERHVIALSSRIKREVKEHYGTPPERITIIPNGVNLEEFNPSTRAVFRDAVRQELGLTGKDFVLLFLGEDFERKGLHLVIEALSYLPDPAVKLIVVGGTAATQGGYQTLATRLSVGDRIRWIEHTRDVVRYCATADLLVLPSVYEPFGLAPLEAMACGTPALISPQCGVMDAIECGGALTLDFLCPELIAGKVADLLQDPSRWQSLSVASAQSAEGLSWDAIASEFEGVCQKIISGE